MLLRCLSTLSLLMLVPLLPGCGQEASDETPSGTLRVFLDSMERGAWDPSSLEEAYGLLCQDARDALRRRAERANGLSRRHFEPWDMIARGRFRLRFAPAPRSIRERIEGDRAVVTVLGQRESDRADVPLVREDGHWRIDLRIESL